MYNKVMESVNYINERIEKTPEIALILGSGLGDLANEIENPIVISFAKSPNPDPNIKAISGVFSILSLI